MKCTHTTYTHQPHSIYQGRRTLAKYISSFLNFPGDVVIQWAESFQGFTKKKKKKQKNNFKQHITFTPLSPSTFYYIADNGITPSLPPSPPRQEKSRVIYLFALNKAWELYVGDELSAKFRSETLRLSMLRVAPAPPRGTVGTAHVSWDVSTENTKDRL